jgi:electron transport complex protein RnfB
MARVSTPTAADLADRIDAVLPQTQCRRCGYDGCRPYAEAVAEGAPINRCPPGADAVVAQLAAMTGRPVMPLDAACGEPGPLRVARINEVVCIGCTLCIDACPVDAIVGAAKRMHTVLAALCTGCELCIAPCPVDCIAMVAAGRAWGREDARLAGERYRARERRLGTSPRDLRGATVRVEQRMPPRGHAADERRGTDERAKRQAAIAAALARARLRRAAAAVRGK